MPYRWNMVLQVSRRFDCPLHPFVFLRFTQFKFEITPIFMISLFIKFVSYFWSFHNLFSQFFIHKNIVIETYQFSLNRSRSSHSKVFCKTVKHLRQSLFFDKVAGLRRRCFKNTFVTEHFWWLLLQEHDYLKHWYFLSSSSYGSPSKVSNSSFKALLKHSWSNVL